MGISSLENFTYQINSFYFLITRIAEGNTYIFTTNEEKEKSYFVDVNHKSVGSSVYTKH